MSTVKHLSDRLRNGFFHYGGMVQHLRNYKIELAETLAAELTLSEFLENKHRLVNIYLQNTLSSNEYERYIETERLHNYKGPRSVEEKEYQITRSRLTSECVRKIDKIGFLAYDFRRPKRTKCSSDADNLDIPGIVLAMLKMQMNFQMEKYHHHLLHLLTMMIYQELQMLKMQMNFQMEKYHHHLLHLLTMMIYQKLQMLNIKIDNKSRKIMRELNLVMK
jgi:hypothetical protein